MKMFTFAIVMLSFSTLASAQETMLVRPNTNERVLSMVQNSKTQSVLGIVDVNGATPLKEGDKVKELPSEMVLEFRFAHYDENQKPVLYRIGDPFTYQELKDVTNELLDGQVEYVQQSLILGTSGTQNPVLSPEVSEKRETMGYLGSASQIFYAYPAPGLYFTYSAKETIKKVSDEDFRQLIKGANLRSKNNKSGTPMIRMD